MVIGSRYTASGFADALLRALTAIAPEGLPGAAVPVEVVRRLTGNPVRRRHRAERGTMLDHPHRRARGRFPSPGLDRARRRTTPTPVRKHSTWRHNPEATASIAATMASVLPRRFTGTVDPGGPELTVPARRPRCRPRTCRRHHPLPGYVDSPSMSSSVSPASSTARRQASTVSDSGSTISLRPIFDCPTPVIATSCSNLRDDAGGRSRGRRSSGSGTVPATPARSGSNSNNGSQTFSETCSNTTRTCVPTETSAGSHPTMFVVSRTRESSSSATIATT